MPDATIRIIGRGERCCLSIESDAPLPGDDHDAAAERIVHGAADIIVAPIARIAERIGVEPMCGELPDGVYITTPDGRVYDWPAVVDKLVSRIAMPTGNVLRDHNDNGTVPNEPHDSIEAAVDAITNVVPGAVIDTVRAEVVLMISDMHQQVHEDLERGDAEGGSL